MDLTLDFLNKDDVSDSIFQVGDELYFCWDVAEDWYPPVTASTKVGAPAVATSTTMTTGLQWNTYVTMMRMAMESIIIIMEIRKIWVTDKQSRN